MKFEKILSFWGNLVFIPETSFLIPIALDLIPLKWKPKHKVFSRFFSMKLEKLSPFWETSDLIPQVLVLIPIALFLIPVNWKPTYNVFSRVFSFKLEKISSFREILYNLFMRFSDFPVLLLCSQISGFGYHSSASSLYFRSFSSCSSGYRSCSSVFPVF